MIHPRFYKIEIGFEFSIRQKYSGRSGEGGIESRAISSASNYVGPLYHFDIIEQIVSVVNRT